MFGDLGTATMKFRKSNTVESCIVVDVSGQIDTFNSTAFQEAIKKIIETGYRKIIFNFAGLTYISSTGVGTTMYILKALQEVEGNLVICGAKKNIHEIYQLLGFTSFFNFCEDEYAALEFYKTGNIVDHTQYVVFPIVYTCPLCEKKYRVAKAGRYKCRECNYVFSIGL